MAPGAEGYHRQAEGRGVEEVLVEEEDLREPAVEPGEPEEPELKRIRETTYLECKSHKSSCKSEI